MEMKLIQFSGHSDDIISYCVGDKSDEYNKE